MKKETWCQLCGKRRECRMVKCDTEHLHPRNTVATGHKGRAFLSVCGECERKHESKYDLN
jgi:hypothetical protein